jgi:hypothetical protein
VWYEPQGQLRPAFVPAEDRVRVQMQKAVLAYPLNLNPAIYTAFRGVLEYPSTGRQRARAHSSATHTAQQHNGFIARPDAAGGVFEVSANSYVTLAPGRQPLLVSPSLQRARFPTSTAPSDLIGCVRFG